MRNLCGWSVVVTVLFSVSGWGQQMALLDAPEPAASSSSLVAGGAGGPAGSSSLTGGAGSAVLPVMRKPAADRRAGLTQTDWTLLGAAGALRLLDYTSTVKAMSDPIHFREDQLPNALVHCRPGLGAFEASMVGVNYYAYRVLVEHRHRKLARWGQVINLAATGWTVGRNYYELHEYWPRQNTLRPDSK
ncbi:MAG TPA: hypothetical protein VHE33_05190 [Acidobacteriaceae bacterium]|nr:hypothetical protein [Acidobacteriaceae bacterium]